MPCDRTPTTSSQPQQGNRGISGIASPTPAKSNAMSGVATDLLSLPQSCFSSDFIMYMIGSGTAVRRHLSRLNIAILLWMLRPHLLRYLTIIHRASAVRTRHGLLLIVQMGGVDVAVSAVRVGISVFASLLPTDAIVW